MLYMMINDNNNDDNDDSKTQEIKYTENQLA